MSTACVTLVDTAGVARRSTSSRREGVARVAARARRRGSDPRRRRSQSKPLTGRRSRAARARPPASARDRGCEQVRSCRRRARTVEASAVRVSATTGEGLDGCVSAIVRALSAGESRCATRRRSRTCATSRCSSRRAHASGAGAAAARAASRDARRSLCLPICRRRAHVFDEVVGAHAVRTCSRTSSSGSASESERTDASMHIRRDRHRRGPRRRRGRVRGGAHGLPRRPVHAVARHGRAHAVQPGRSAARRRAISFARSTRSAA